MSNPKVNGDVDKAQEQKTAVDEAPSTSKASNDGSVEILIEESNVLVSSTSRTSQEIVEPSSSSAKDEDASTDGDVICLDDDSDDDLECLWRGNSVSTAIQWVQQHINTGADPRALIRQLRPPEQGGPGDVALAFTPTINLWQYLLQILSEPPKRKKLPEYNTLQDAVELIKSRKKIMVLTGAGVSVSCGIPDFRSKNGIYARLHLLYPDLPDPQAMFDIDYFRKNQRPFFDFAKEIYPGQFTPSRAHRFIATLEANDQLLRNYTQNIDTLEQVAGIHKLVQCHGSFAAATCCACGHKCDSEAIREDIFAKRIPRCPKCPPETSLAIMKPDIVFFGESLPDIFHVQITADKDEVDLLIIMGSSMKVRPVALVPDSIPHTVPLILINNEPLSHINADIELIGDLDTVLDELCFRLSEPFKALCTEGKNAPLKPVDINTIDFEAIRAEMKQLAAEKASDEPTTKRARVSDDRLPVAECVQADEYVFEPPSRSIFRGAHVFKYEEVTRSDDSSSSTSSSDSESSTTSLPARFGDDSDDELNLAKRGRCRSI